MHVLLTGGSGFIGNEVLKRLVAENDRVRLLIRPETLERWQSPQQLCQRDALEIVPGSLTDAKTVMKAHQGIEVVYHLAWHWKHGSQSQPRRENEAAQINLEMARNVLRGCAKHNVRR